MREQSFLSGVGYEKIPGPLQFTDPLSLASCGDETTNITNTTPPRNDDGTVQREEEQGAYDTERVTIINRNIVQNIKEENTVIIKGDDIDINVNVRGAPPVRCTQYVHVQNQCRAVVDVNRDGYVDEVETRRSCGKVLVALDDDVENDEENVSNLPRPDAQGTYVYRVRASLERLITELRSPERESSGKYVLLGPDENLDLDTRVLVIYGVFDAANYPATVARSELDSTKVILPISWTPFRKSTLPQTDTPVDDNPSADDLAENRQPETDDSIDRSN